MKNLLFVISMAAFIFVAGQLQATPCFSANLPAEEKTEEVGKLRIKIIIIIIIKKKTDRGVIAEVSDIRLATSGGSLKANEVAATAELSGGKLSLKLDKSSTKVAQLIMPQGFKVSREVSLKLGSKTNVVMSGGTTMFRETNSLGNFEIQD